MSFILDPFIFEQLENFYERILTMPYTYNVVSAGGVIETKVIRIPYTYNFNIYVNLETYKIVKMPYTTNFLATSGSNETRVLRIPYTFEFSVSGGAVPANQDGYPYLSYETF